MAKSDYEKRIELIRSRYPRAYDKWTLEDIAALEDGIQRNLPVADIAKALQRQPSAVRSRLNRLSPPKPDSESSLRFSLDVSGEWVRTFAGDDREYEFPGPISDFMLKKYNQPAIYRWISHKPNASNGVLYIGQTRELCPDRLKSYLRPRRSSTNRRINTHLEELARGGHSIRLEIFKATSVRLCGQEVHTSLKGDVLREAVEAVMIANHQREHPGLLNRQ